jgi:hypothetical protein
MVSTGVMPRSLSAAAALAVCSVMRAAIAWPSMSWLTR